MYKLLSERNNPDKLPDVFSTDIATPKFRNQIRTMNKLLFEKYFSLYDDNTIIEVCIGYDFAKGNPPKDFTYTSACNYIDHCVFKYDPVDVFDLLDIICSKLHSTNQYCYCDYEKTINEIFLVNAIGYKAVEGKLIPYTDAKMVEEVIVPTFSTLDTHGFVVARSNLVEAYDLLKDKNIKQAILSAHNALESVIESILDEREIVYDKKDKTFNKIQLLLRRGILPKYMESSIGSLSNLVQFPGTIRNNVASHGSSEEEKVDDTLAKYVIDMVASSIIFIIKVCYE